MKFGKGSPILGWDLVVSKKPGLILVDHQKSTYTLYLTHTDGLLILT